MTAALSQSFMPVVSCSDSLDEAFPDVDPNYIPFGSNVCLQVRIARSKVSKDSKIELPDEVRATIQANTQVAKVISHGPLAFRNRTTGEFWPEGAWAKPGDFVRIPKYCKETWEVKYEDGVVMFVVLKDLELGGMIPRPLEMVAYI